MDFTQGVYFDTGSNHALPNPDGIKKYALISVM